MRHNRFMLFDCHSILIGGWLIGDFNQNPAKLGIPGCRGFETTETFSPDWIIKNSFSSPELEELNCFSYHGGKGAALHRGSVHASHPVALGSNPGSAEFYSTA